MRLESYIIYRTPLRAALVFFVVISISACGPYRSNAAIRDAEAVRDTVANLQTSANLQTDANLQTGANLKKPDSKHGKVDYAFAKGEAFLRQARLSAGHSDHTGAIEFAQIARESYFQAQIILESAASSAAAPAPPPQTVPPNAGGIIRGFPGALPANARTRKTPDSYTPYTK